MLNMKFFRLIFRGKFEQKTQKSIFLKNQWRLKNIKKAMVVKNIIADDMSFTKSIFEQFWRSYCKKTVCVVFHFLKFLPIRNSRSRTENRCPILVHEISQGCLTNKGMRRMRSSCCSNMLFHPAPGHKDYISADPAQFDCLHYQYQIMDTFCSWLSITLKSLPSED